jgi:sugar O-acyltransferase (sialic acid O-acetyltransferase NeuD family)
VKSKQVVIIGSAAHGRVIKDNLQSHGDAYTVIGYLDSVKDIGEMVDGTPVIGRQNELKKLIEKFGDFAGIVAIGDNFLREKVVKQVLEQLPEFEFVNAIHSSVIVSTSATIGKGNVLMPGVIVNSQATIHNHCIINTNSSLEHNCVMENYSSISAGVTTGGFVSIGAYSSVALGVTIFDRVTIGSNVVIGSGSLVTKDIEDDVLAYGIPAKSIRKREKGEKFLK